MPVADCTAFRAQAKALSWPDAMGRGLDDLPGPTMVASSRGQACAGARACRVGFSYSSDFMVSFAGSAAGVTAGAAFLGRRAAVLRPLLAAVPRDAPAFAADRRGAAFAVLAVVLRAAAFAAVRPAVAFFAAVFRPLPVAVRLAGLLRAVVFAAALRAPPAAFFGAAALRAPVFAAALRAPPAAFFGAAVLRAEDFAAALRVPVAFAVLLRVLARTASGCARGLSDVVSWLLTSGNSCSWR